MKTFVQHRVVLFWLFFISSLAVAQPRFLDSLEVNVGLSTTDHINIGMRYRFNQNNIGVMWVQYYRKGTSGLGWWLCR
jgi:hypothetical protein